MKPENALSRLIEARSPDGGWGWRAGASPNTECTALATLALARGEGARAAAAGVEWLKARQQRDGSWSLGDDVPGSSWMSSLAVLALATVSPGGHASRGAHWLLNERSARLPLRERMRRLFGAGRTEVDEDPDLIGWPWRHGTWPWVEPTAWSMLALKSVPGLPPRPVATRVEQAEALLADRMSPGGGWNYGNRSVRGVDLVPYPDTTAIALLALQDRRGEPFVAQSRDRLGELLRTQRSLLSLSLGILALQLHGADVDELREEAAIRLARAAAAPLTDCRAAALGVLALGRETMAFGMSNAR